MKTIGGLLTTLILGLSFGLKGQAIAERQPDIKALDSAEGLTQNTDTTYFRDELYTLNPLMIEAVNSKSARMVKQTGRNRSCACGIFGHRVVYWQPVHGGLSYYRTSFETYNNKNSLIPAYYHISSAYGNTIYRPKLPIQVFKPVEIILR